MTAVQLYILMSYFVAFLVIGDLMIGAWLVLCLVWGAHVPED